MTDGSGDPPLEEMEKKVGKSKGSVDDEGKKRSIPGREAAEKVVNRSKKRTKRAIARSKKKTRTVIKHGTEDLLSAKDILREEVGYSAYKREEDKKAYFIRAAKLFGPPCLMLMWYLFLLWFPVTENSTKLVTTSMLYMFPSPFGKETMIPTAVASGAGKFYVALTFTFVDAFLVTFFALNFDYIKRVPNIGRHAKRLERAARSFLDKPNFANIMIKQFATIGIFGFVMLPFQGGGGANGAILGRVMGLRAERVIIAATLGTAVESFALTYASGWFLSLIPNWAGYVGYGIIILALILYLIAARKKRKKKEIIRRRRRS